MLPAKQRTCPSCPPHPDTLQLVEERKGDGSALDASGSGAVAERDGATLRLKEGGGVFYAPGPLQSVAVHWPRLPQHGADGCDYVLIGRAEVTANRPFDLLIGDLRYALKKLHAQK